MDKDIINLEQFLDDLNDSAGDDIYIYDMGNQLYVKYKKLFDWIFDKLEIEFDTELDTKFRIEQKNEIDFEFCYYTYNQSSEYISDAIDLSELETEVKWTIIATFSGGGDDGDIEILEYEGLPVETDEANDLSYDFICELINTYISHNYDWYNNNGGSGQCTWNHTRKTFSYDLELYDSSYFLESITSNKLAEYVLKYNER
jgi:hypothetical protein